MRRRKFITLLGSAAAAWPLVARAQQPSQMRRIGVLIAAPENDADAKRMLRALLQGLQELGWKPGTNLQIEIRYGGGLPERIAAAAKELVAAQPEVLEIETTPGTAAVLMETPIQSEQALFRASHIPAATPQVSSISNPQWAANGSSCSRM
jgi:putative tryptophan/tyrosine transport system substrate-binding protein